eukprot:jgi/Chlat1/1854/Chrsp141S02174
MARLQTQDIRRPAQVISLQTQDISLQAPGISLRTQVISLQAPDINLRAPDINLRAQVISLQALDISLPMLGISPLARGTGGPGALHGRGQAHQVSVQPTLATSSMQYRYTHAVTLSLTHTCSCIYKLVLLPSCYRFHSRTLQPPSCMPSYSVACSHPSSQALVRACLCTRTCRWRTVP